jgi:cytochrome b561
MDNQEISPQSDDQQQYIISVGEWVLYLFLFSIPLVNIIMLCIWAFGNDPNPTKSNFGKAGLIWIAFFIVIYIVFLFMAFSFFSTTFNEMNQMQTM